MLTTANARKFTGAGILFLILFLASIYRSDMVSTEGAVYEEACELILAKTSEGRQALVSSAWWPPLNTLLRLPFAVLARMDTAPTASTAVAALFGVAILLLLVRMCEANDRSRIGMIAVAALPINPFFIEQCINGSSATTAAFFALLACYGLTEWIRLRKLRGLVYMGTGCALLLLSAFDMALVAAAALLLFAVDLAAAHMRPGEKSASALLVLLPVVYSLALWVLMNWLIMGDGFYFLRGVIAAARSGAAANAIPLLHSAQAGVPPVFMGAALLCGAAAILGLLARSAATLCFGLMGIAVFGAGFAAHAVFPGSDSSHILFAMFPIAAGAAIATAADRKTRTPTVIAALGSFVLSATIYHDAGLLARWRSGSEAATRMEVERLFLRNNIEQHILRQTRYPRVFVCGYDGLLLVRPPTDEILIHTLDLDFQRIVDDFKGCSLYVLVRRPTTGLYGADSVHWKYPGIYENGHKSLLFDSQWDEWRMFELIQAPRRQ